GNVVSLEGCDFEGKRYGNGDVFSHDPCVSCTCENGRVQCQRARCHPLSCLNQYTPEGECCPICRPEQPGEMYPDSVPAHSMLKPPSETRPVLPHLLRDCSRCDFHGQIFLDGVSFSNSLDPCKRCVCTTALLWTASLWRPFRISAVPDAEEGKVHCQSETCETPCKNPTSPRPGTCCPVCEGCGMNGRDYLNGEQVPVADRCQNCVCVNGDLHCSSTPCPPTPCRNPVRRPGECCARCEQCEYESQVYVDGQTFASHLDPCLRCHCLGGEVTCERMDKTCPPLRCTHPAKTKGQCCPTCDSQCCATCDRCTYNQRMYSNGQDFTDPDEPCQQCRCQDGTVQCTVTQCRPLTCSNPQTPPGQCCPQCPGCNYAGKEYPNGMEFPHPTDQCRTCHCINGNVQCLMKRCPAQQCSNPFMVHGQCCPQCPAPPADCLHAGQSYKHTEHFYDPLDKCRTCICTNGSVSCQRRPCAHAHCTHPILQDCCRTCDGCLYDGKEHANGEMFGDPSDPCGMCVCRQGTVTCERKRCPAATCPFPVQTQCCQVCDGCNYVGEEYLNGQEFTDPRSRCNRCSCSDGHVTCSPKPCYTAGCSHPVTPSGSCCPVCEGCFYNNVAVINGQSFPDPQDSECSECTCRAGTVQCVKKICPPAPCSHPAPGPCDCPGRSYIDGDIFAGRKGSCEECRCLRGEVTCGSKRCPKVTCQHPATDPCSCPVCDGCHFNGRDCKNGDRFPDPKNKCQRCTCLNGGVTCVSVTCPPPPCRNPITPPGECCPVCTGMCEHLGQVYESGTSFDSPSDRCDTCTCLNEVVSCRRKPCPQQCSHPLPLGSCCPVCDGCLYEGVQYTSSQTFTPRSNPCQRCSCVRGNVACTPQVCPPTPCRNPVTPPNQCCPQCPVCFHKGQEYADGLHWISSTNNCQECTCVGGEVQCSEVTCKLPCSHPSPPSLGQCCPLCQDCFLDGVLYSDGDEFTLDGCRQLEQKKRGELELLWRSEIACEHGGGDILCTSVECPKLTCMHQVTEPGTCCPRCRGCVYDGREHEEGSTWFASSTPCMSCMCVDGVTTCSEVRCVSPCLNHIQVPGECCAVCADCVYNGQIYGPGDSFHPSNDPCQICTCEVMPDGEQHLRCYRKQCPSLVDCPKNFIQFSGPDPCCPVCAPTEQLHSRSNRQRSPCHERSLFHLSLQGCLPLSCPLSEQFTPEDSCCPICNECVIEGDNQRVANGESWTDSVDECITCTCNLGYIECSIQECGPLVCQDGLVKVKSPGQCCYECQDPSVSCSYQGTVYQSNEHWEVDECTSCTCVSGEVHCQTERCPQVTCASDETPALIPGMCCPHCIPRPATCIAFGDPHYRTFDGKMINFQGSCTYVLAEDCEGGDFSIHVTNDDRGRKGVSWTKEVTIFIGDVMVQLLQKWVVMVDYQKVTLPFLKEPYIYVERKTNTILLNTNIGVKVMWNGRSHLEVSVPGTYKNHMCGLCGNFNNYPQDDMRLRTGQTVKSEAAFGNSWKVRTENDTAVKCRDGKDIDPCKEAGYSARKTSNARCAVLKSEVFERCHKVIPPEMFYASCVYDLCACGANTDDCLCDTLEAYASECREAGVILQWRTHALCAVGCPLDRGFVFDECGPPCPKTCFNKDVPLGVIESHCFKPCVPGCQCPAGLVEHESHCIAPEACPKIIYGNS
ncbi:hypothetical protein JZ751_008758, partial [Albula glossodonta]